MAAGNIPAINLIGEDEVFFSLGEEFGVIKDRIARKIANLFLQFDAQYNPVNEIQIEGRLRTVYLDQNRRDIRDTMTDIFEEFQDNLGENIDADDHIDRVLSMVKDFVLINTHRKLMRQAGIDYTDLSNGEIDLDAGRRKPFIQCILAKLELFIEYINYRVGLQDSPPLKEYKPKLYKKIVKRCIGMRNQNGGMIKRRLGYIRKRR